LSSERESLEPLLPREGRIVPPRGAATPGIPAADADENPGRRVIRPRPGGALLDHRFRLEDVSALTDALVRASEGRIERLRGAASEVEQRLRRQVEQSRQRIAAAIEAAELRIEERVQETARRAGEAIEKAHREGREHGEREGFAAGYSEGLEKGLREGRESALEEARSRVRTLVPALEELVADFGRERRELRESAQRELLELALEVARRVVRREVEMPPPVVVESLRAAIERIDRKRGLVIEIHPADRAAAEECLPGLLGGIAAEEAVTIVEHPERSRGGCRVRTECGTVDETIETQFELLDERVLGREEVLG